MFCERYCLVKWQSSSIIVQPLKCRTWDCSECRPGRQQKLMYEARCGQPNRFITLTSRNHPGDTPSQAAQDLVRAWRTIRREWIKKHGKSSLAFLAVFEETKRGWPHLHIVVRSEYIPQKWLSKRMRELTGAPNVGIVKLTSAGKASSYIAKYIGKKPYRFAGTKRYWRSLDYILKAPEQEQNSKDQPSPWTCMEMSADLYCKTMEPYYEVSEVTRNTITLRVKEPAFGNGNHHHFWDIGPPRRWGTTGLKAPP